MVQTIIAAIYLARPVNVLIAILSFYVGGFVAMDQWITPTLFLACLSGGLITAAANTINDYFDVDIDRINRPLRPLPAGWISPAMARMLAFAEYMLGIGLAMGLPLIDKLMAPFFSLLTYFYSAHLKRKPLVGNLTVSLSTAAAFIYGAVAGGNIQAGIFPAIFAFLFHLGREIIKDIQDYQGDQLQQAQTLPVRAGIPIAIWFVRGTFLLLGIATFIPYAIHFYSDGYFWIVLLGIYPLIFYAFWQVKPESGFNKLEKISILLKADMVVGLVAIIVGSKF